MAPVRRGQLFSDTSLEIEAIVVEGWRRMSTVDVAQQLNAAWAAGQQLTWFSLKERYPDASDDELRIRLAAERFGWDLAAQIHPGAAALRPS